MSFKNRTKIVFWRGLLLGSWKQVFTNTFGLPLEFNSFGQHIRPITSTSYQGNEGYKVIVFKNQLYLGMESENTLGTSLWRILVGVTVPQKQIDL